jgi:hypothetical protein
MDAVNVLWILAILGGFLYVSFELGKIRARLSSLEKRVSRIEKDTQDLSDMVNR